MYRVDSGHEWFVVDVNSRRLARREGVREWGRGWVTSVSKATQEDIDYIRTVKGDDALLPSCF